MAAAATASVLDPGPGMRKQFFLIVLIFLSNGYFESANCVREVRAAHAAKKPLVLVHETDEAKGGDMWGAIKMRLRRSFRVLSRDAKE